jgi:hypothetical protein
MALTVTTGYRSLVSLGIGVGDAVSLINLGQRFGNWITTKSGDEQLISMLDEDEFTFLKRKGLIDIPSFNKRWRQELRLLANGKPMHFKDENAQKVLEDLGRFSSIMVCIVAVLDQFCTLTEVRIILNGLLKTLLRATENGEDILKAQLMTRLNAWRSTACIRGLSTEAKRVHESLANEGLILWGLVPAAESRDLEGFLVWLLGSEDPEFFTSSSDIAGIALCLSRLGLDLISVEGMGLLIRKSACVVIYSIEGFLHETHDVDSDDENGVFLERTASTTVPLAHPEESVSIFPLNTDTQNRCRSAWRAGQRAAAFTGIGVVATRVEEHYGEMLNDPVNLTYSFIDRGTEPERPKSAEVYDLASSAFPILSKELLDLLEQVLAHYSGEVMSVLSQQIPRMREEHPDWMGEPKLTTEILISAFSVFQSFFMGFYYSVFFRVVDTSTLQLQICEGAWGFRDAGLMHYILRFFLMQPPDWKRKATIFTRQQLVQLLSRLFLGSEIDLDESQRVSTWCMGVVSKRTLLVNSMLGKCSTPDEVGGFTLLDVDVGGVPRDTEGIIRCGIPDTLVAHYRYDFENDIRDSVAECSPPEDVTFHIEADWSTRPDSALLCIRYHGRRITTISPASADSSFCRDYVEPIVSTNERTVLHRAMSIGIENLINPERPFSMSAKLDIPVLFQALDRPRLRYTAQALLDENHQVHIASNCIENAGRRAREVLKSAKSKQHRIYNSHNRTTVVLIAGMQNNQDVYPPVESASGKLVYEITTAQ